MAVYIGWVETFPNVTPSKMQALKVLEEASEIFGAWQALDGHWWDDEDQEEELLVDECADVIQATCNLLESLGCNDMGDAMARCKRRNQERGRM